MKVSVIIPTYNASAFLSDLLTSLSHQTVQDKEITVIDSSSQDDTVEIAKSFNAKIIVIPKEEFDHGRTRSLGGIKSEGDVLVYMTQDALPANVYALENLIKPFSSNNEIAAVFGRQLPYLNASLIAAHLRLFNYPDDSYIRGLEDREIYGIKTIFFSDSFSAYKRNSMDNIGWFKENLIFGEDTRAAAQLLLADYKITYRADAMVYHSHNYTPSQEFRRYFDIGVFHRTEDWIIKEFGKAKGEGMKYIQSGISYLKKHNKSGLIPSFVFRNVLKYFGYSLGLRYDKIPRNLAAKCSMNRNWWKKTVYNEG